MTWFEDLVGFPEESPEQVRANLSMVDDHFLRSGANGRTFRCGDLSTPSLEELRAQTSQSRRSRWRDPTTLKEVVGDVQSLHQARENNGGLFQVASQFNLLEMVGPEVTPEEGVGIYESDHTQGPACAVVCGAATIFRNYFASVDGGQVGQTADKQVDCLRDLGGALGNQANSLWRMRNGYALASEAGLRKVAAAIEAADRHTLDSLRGQLRVGAQFEAEVTLENGSNIVSQAFCSALPIRYCSHHAELWEPFARLVLEAAYEATLHLGALNREKTGSSKVFLTCVGGGAFGNPGEWIASAIKRAVQLFHCSGLDIQIVSYGNSNPDVQKLMREFASSREPSGRGKTDSWE